MKKMLRVAQHEFLSNVKSPTFLFAAFGMPIFITLLIFIVVAVIDDSENNPSNIVTIGYIDQANIIGAGYQSDQFVPIASSELAMDRLTNDEINAYIIIPNDYMETGDIEAFTNTNLPEVFEEEINQFLLSNLSDGVESNFPLERLQSDINLMLTIQSMGRTMTEDATVGLFLVPMIFAIVFLLASQITATFLMSSIVMEKTNRIMEILIISVTPMELLMGKIIGLGSLGLVQMLIWILVGGAVAVFGADIPILAGIAIPLDMIVLSIIYFILTYFLLSSLMAGISVLVDAEQESRQIAGFVVLPFVLPFIFIVQLLEDPNGTIAILLTLFPFSSAMTVIMRASFSPVPIEQIILSLVLLTLSSILVTWVSAKVFRWATLLYGKRPTPRELWRVIRSEQVDLGTLVRDEAS